MDFTAERSVYQVRLEGFTFQVAWDMGSQQLTHSLRSVLFSEDPALPLSRRLAHL